MINKVLWKQLAYMNRFLYNKMIEFRVDHKQVVK